MKGFVVNTKLGILAQSLRDRLAIHRAIGTNLEVVGMLANDHMARYLLERLCLPGKTFIDVGSHIGSVIAGVSQHSRPRKIIAIEAIPDKASRIQRRFPLTEVHCCAVGEQEGNVSFFIDEKNSGYSSLDPKTALGFAREISVRIYTLDKIVSDYDIDVIKIDVEGGELGVLRGSRSIVDSCRPVIMFESATRAICGYSPGGLWDWFNRNDYIVSAPNRVAHLNASMSRETFLDAHNYPRLTTNYFGIARERLSEVRQRARCVSGL